MKLSKKLFALACATMLVAACSKSAAPAADEGTMPADGAMMDDDSMKKEDGAMMDDSMKKEDGAMMDSSADAAVDAMQDGAQQ